MKLNTKYINLVFYLLLCLTLSTSKISKTGKKVNEKSSNTLLSTKSASANAEMVECETVGNLIKKYTEDRNKFKSDCKINEMPELNDFYESSEILGTLSGKIVRQEFTGDDQILARFQKLGENSNYAKAAAALISKGSEAHQSEFTAIWNKMDDDLSALNKNNGGYPHEFNVAIWKNLKLTSQLKEAELVFENQNACLPAYKEAIPFVAEWLAYYDYCCCNYKFEILNTDSFHLPSNAFVVHGISLSSFSYLESVDLQKESQPLIHGYKNNEKIFDFTFEAAKKLGVTDLKINYRGKEYRLTASSSCTEIGYVNIFFDRQCGNIKMVVAYRNMQANGFASMSLDVEWKDVEGLNFNYVSETYSKQVYYNVNSTPEDEVEIYTEFSSDLMQEYLKELEPCDNSVNCAYYHAGDDRCIECAERFFILDKTCYKNCPKGYSNNEEGYCERLCKDDCVTCEKAEVCEECKAPSLRFKESDAKVSCVEKCPTGSYLNLEENMCMKCVDNCISCSDSETCQTCDYDKTIQDGLCVDKCKEGYFQDFNPKTCVKCTEGCESCKILDRCDRCAEGFYMKNGVCVKNCGSGLFGNDHTRNCEPCSDFCESCDETTCSACIKGFDLVDGVCLPHCEPNQTLFKGVCVSCTDSNCLTCDLNNLQICKKCNSDFVLENGKCVTSCSEGSYANETGECVPCPKNCQACNKDKCLMCDKDMYLFGDNQCIRDCPDNYIVSGLTCLKCTNPTCKKCLESSLDVCESCHVNFLLEIGKCVDKCNNGYYQSGNNCLECNKGCKQCDNGISCNVCQDEYFLKYDTCVKDCGTGFRADNETGNCEKCSDSNCSNCNSSVLECQRCDSPFVLHAGKCVTKCPVGTFVTQDFSCNDCLQDCDDCSNESTCNRCKLPKVLYKDRCINECPDSTINIEKVCINCTDPDCKTCDSSLEKCLQCKIGSFLHDGECVDDCPVGYFNDVNKCTPCNPLCTRCTSSTVCQACIENFILLKNHSCTDKCPPKTIKGEIDRNVDITFPVNMEVTVGKTEGCIECSDEGCLKCSDKDVSRCILCESPLLLLNGDCFKECPKGFYADNEICSPCSQGCQKCTSPLSCDKCEEGLFLKGTACESDCGDGYIAVNDECIKCKDNCKSCEANRLDYCTVCPEGLLLLDGKCVTECPAKYWENTTDKTCLPCSVPNCSVCSSSGATCDKCAFGLILNDNSCLPSCPTGRVEVDGVCQICYVNNCAVCPASNTKICTTCVTPNLLVNDYTCSEKCPQGKFSNGLSCDNCPNHCAECNNANTCKRCENQFVMYNGQCVTSCPEGTREEEGICHSCGLENCSACTSAACVECKKPLVLSSGKCVTECEEGTYNDGKSCECCSNFCEKCDSFENCLTCEEGKLLTDGKCLDKCPDKYVQKETKCLKCNTGANCQKCDVNDPDTCTNCKDEFVQLNNDCLENCPQGFYTLNRECMKCINNCSICSNSSQCQQCASNFYLLNDRCVSDCPTGYYELLGKCVACSDSNCAACPDDNCNKCKYNFYKEEGVCVNQCSPGFFLYNFSECRKCPENCIDCSDANTCTNCINGLAVKNGQCVEDCGESYVNISNECKPCDNGCKVCSKSDQHECLECSELNLKNGKCVSDCGATNYADNKVCKSCIDNCDVCDSTESCSKCSAGFVYQGYLNKCLNECISGYTNIDGVCQPCGVAQCMNCSSNINTCDQCYLNLFKLGDACVSECPVEKGFYVDNRDCLNCSTECATCKSATDCRTCIKGFVLSESNTCINKCPEGETEVHGKCVDCQVSSCLVCSDPATCIKCALDKVLLNNECLDSCPESYFNNNGTCEPCNNNNCSSCANSSVCDVCKPGFLLDDGVCVASCPEGKVERNLKCYPCNDKNCLNCDNLTLDSCSNCRLPYKLKGTNCVDDCGLATFITEVNGSQTCNDCKRNCASCTSSDNCNQCADNFFLKNNECVESCGPNYVAVENECRKCTEDECEVCSSTNQDVCLKCSSPNFLNNLNKCVATCGERFYEKESPLAICVNCRDNNCLQCSPEDECSLCDKGFSIYNLKCVEKCPSGFYSDNSDNRCKLCAQKVCDQCVPSDPSRCENCKAGFFLYNGECVDSCPRGTFVNDLGNCQDCNKNCEHCKDNTTCYVCKSPFALEGVNCTDNCPQGKVNVNNVCVDCTQKTECLKCDPAAVDKCLECQPQFYLLNSGACVQDCPSGTFPNGSRCTECEPNCQTCTSETDCQVCVSPFVEFKGDCLAACERGFINIDGHCVPCDDSVRCNTCLKDLTTCVECREPLVLNVDNTCRSECSAGTYLNLESNKCENCGEHCNKCDNDKLCNDCTAPYSNNGGTCVSECPDHTYLDAENNCKPCQALNCIKCSNLNPNKCLRCNEGLVLSGEPDTECVEKCPTGTVLKTASPSPAFVQVKSKKLRLGKGIITVQERYPECFPCPQGCASCDESSCTACVSTLVLVDGKCVSDCKPGYTKRDNTCLKCTDPHCEACDPNNLNNCLTCQQPTILFEGACLSECPTGLFLKGDTCVPCAENCHDCHEFGCNSCNDGFVFNGDTDQCTTCIAPSQEIDGRCRTCDVPNCNKCVEGNVTSCESCTYPSVLLNGKCEDKCPNGYFAAASVCHPCPKEAETCENRPCTGDGCAPGRIDEEITKCKRPKVLLRGRCLDTCPDNFTEIDGYCKPCSQSECLSCEKDQSTCNKCSDTTWLFKGECVDSCPERYLYINGTCEKCSDSCIKCETERCTQCEEGKKLQNDKCVTICSVGYFDQGDSCVPCLDNNCDVCSPVSSCQVCNAHTYLTNTESCVTNCADGYFKNEETRKCDKCDNGCVKCTAQGQCIECAESLNMLYGQCLAECPAKMTPLNRSCVNCNQPECLSCQVSNPDKCTKCEAPGALYQGQCLSACPLSTFSRDGVCQDCDSKCLHCTDENTCTKCKPEFFLNGTQCESKCPDGKTSVENERCVDCGQPNCKSCTANLNSCIECNSPYNLFNEKCVITCPDGTYASNGKCVACNEGCSKCNSEGQCDQCKSGYYLLNDECIKSCPAGYYPDCKTDECKKCDDSCKTCSGSGPENCSTCAEGYFLNGKVCMKPEHCSPGTYANPADFSCSPCKLLYCKECSDATTCTLCNNGFTLDEGKCVIGNSLMNVFPNTRFFDDYTFTNTNGNTFNLAEIGGVGISSPHVTIAFWMRHLVPYEQQFTNIISFINSSNKAYDYHLGVDGTNNKISMIVRDHKNNDVIKYDFTPVAYDILKDWQLVSLSIVKNKNKFLVTFSYQDSGKFVPSLMEVPREPAVFEILTKESTLVFNHNPDNNRGNFQIFNPNIFDYIPDTAEIINVEGVPSDCDYGCTDCKIYCKKCLDGNSPNQNYCKAIGPTVNGLRIADDKPLSVNLFKELDHDNVSDKHAFTLWFFIDKEVDLTSTEVKLYQDFYSATGDNNNLKNNNNVVIQEGKIVVNGVKVSSEVTLSTNKWYHLYVGFSTDDNLVGLTDTARKSNDSPFLIFEHVKNPDIFIRFFNHYTVEYSVPSGSYFNVNTYVNNWPAPEAIKNQHNDVNVPAHCVTLGKDQTCTECEEDFELAKDGTCQDKAIDINSSVVLLERYDVWNNNPIELTINPESKDNWTLTLFLRKKTHSNVIQDKSRTNSILSYTNNSGKVPTTEHLITESINDKFESIITLNTITGNKRLELTHAFNHEIYNYIHVAIVFNNKKKIMTYEVLDFNSPSAPAKLYNNEDQSSTSLNTDEKTPRTFTDKLSAPFTTDRLTVGNLDGEETNFEVTWLTYNSNAYDSKTIKKVRDNLPIDCDPACKSGCDYKTGKCGTCAIGAHNVMVCQPFLLGFSNTYTYDIDIFSDSNLKKTDFINLLTQHGFNVDVNSLDYSAIGYFKVWGKLGSDSNTNHRIVSIGNKGKINNFDNDAGKHVAVMDLNPTSETTSVITFTISAENIKVKVPVDNFTVNNGKWYAYHFGVNVVNKKFTFGIIDMARKEEIHGGSGDYPEYPEKLQEVGGISLLGVNDNLDSKEYSSLNVHTKSSFFIPNKGYNPDLFKIFLDKYPLPEDAKCNNNCETCVENSENQLVCLSCARGYDIVNNECVPLVNRKKTYKYAILTQKITTQPTEINITGPSFLNKDFTLMFYLRRNYYQQNGSVNVLTAGQISVNVVASGMDDSVTVLVGDRKLTTETLKLYDWNLISITYSKGNLNIANVHASNPEYDAEPHGDPISVKGPLSFDKINLNTNKKEFSFSGLFIASKYLIKSEVDWPQYDCVVDCLLCLHNTCKSCAYGRNDDDDECNSNHITLQNKNIETDTVINYQLAEFMPYDMNYHSRKYSVEFIARIEYIDSVVPVFNIGNHEKFSHIDLSYNPENEHFYLKYHCRQTVVNDDTSTVTEINYPSKLVKSSHFIAISVSSSTITYYFFSNGDNSVIGEIEHKCDMDYLTTDTHLSFLNDGTNGTQGYIKDAIFYYDEAHPMSKFTAHATIQNDLIQPICAEGDRDACTSCLEGSLLDFVCAPSADSGIFFNNYELLVTKWSAGMDDQKYKLADGVNKISSFTLNFNLKINGFNDNRQGILKLTFGNGKNMKDFYKVVYDSNKNALELILPTSTITFPNFITSEALYQWHGISINVGLKSKKNYVHSIIVRRLSLSSQESEETIINQPILETDNNAVVYISLGFEDTVSSASDNVNFVISDIQITVNNKISSDNLEQYLPLPFPVCHVPCKVSCINAVCPKGEELIDDINMADVAGNTTDEAPLFRPVFDDAGANQSFTEYLISFDLDVNSFLSSSYSVNKDVLFLVHADLNQEYDALSINDLIPDNLVSRGIFSLVMNNGDLRIYSGYVPWDNASSFYEINLGGKKLSDFKRLYFMFSIDTSTTHHNLLILADDISFSHRIELMNRSGLVSFHSFVYSHPVIRKLNLNVYQPRFYVDISRNANSFIETEFNTNLCGEAGNNCSQCLGIDNTADYLCHSCKKGFLFYNGQCSQSYLSVLDV